MTRKRLYWAIRGKAEQLEPFSETGVPIFIVLANPGGAEVDLGQRELTATMFGGPTNGTPNAYSVESLLGAKRVVHEPGFGVFCETHCRAKPVNRWPHISGVAVLEQGVTYYDLSGYRLGSGPSVPDSWFTGPQDQRIGFDADGLSFGPQRPVGQALP